MKRRDTELLSAYLDGELKPSDSTKLEARLKTDPELASVLNDIRATRALLRKLPSRKAPRNFTLTRKMVGQNPPLPRTYPIFRLATVVATLLFFFTIGINSFGTQMASQNTAFGIGGSGGGGDSESLAADSQVMESAPAEPAAPAPAEEPAAEPEAYADTYEAPPTDLAAPTDDMLRIMETPSSKNGEAENAVEAEQVQARQEAPRIVSSSWQVVLAIVALLSALLMGLMRQLSARRWK
ncbi:MAG TPA: hypothetical protein VJ972_04390 [Anaerolineales bacterium]|nr:hypothetical protein [Anaerolineales bacterium]